MVCSRERTSKEISMSRGMAILSGKAVVVVTDFMSDYPVVRAIVQSYSSAYFIARDALEDDIQYNLSVDAKQLLSRRQRSLPDGTTLRLLVTCQMRHCDDDDFELDVLRVKTLREQLPTRKMRKRWKLLDKHAKRSSSSLTT